MDPFPESIAHELLANLVGDARVAYVILDDAGLVRERGGELAWFGLEDVALGEPVDERIEPLQGSLPTIGESDVLPRIELVPGRATDVHIGAHGDGAFLLFLDVTREADHDRRLQQKGNELSLMMRTLGVAVFEDVGGELRRLGLSPSWARALLGTDPRPDLAESFPFLENFLIDARATWELRGPRIAWSGPWMAEDGRGREWQLEATATRLEDGRKILAVQSLEHRYEERHRLLQMARTRSLDFDRLRREIDKKEALLHYIIHDLKGPLGTMVGSMSLIKDRELDPERARELLELGLEQARHQESMIRSILDAFSAEIESLQHFESEEARAPDLLSAVSRALDTYRLAYEQNRVGLELRASPDLPQSCKVVGEDSRLVRVLCNLLENALRVSPESGVVEVFAEPCDAGFRITVRDQGPGVPEQDREGLFARFARTGVWGGTAGLGLYFCRSTVEMWGGSIGYQPADPQGACFWFELPRAL